VASEGTETRHQRTCRSHAGGRCSCQPSFRASVWSPRDGKLIRKTSRDRNVKPGEGEKLIAALPTADRAVWATANAQLMRTLERSMGTVRDPLPRSICPADGETPPKTRMPDGGWLHTADALAAPERRRKRAEADERQRRQAQRRVTIAPEQPQPNPAALRELLRGGGEFR
jgi:hypothetical protein